MSTWTVSDPCESGTKKPRVSPVTGGLQSRVTSMAVGARLVLLLGYTGLALSLGDWSFVFPVSPVTFSMMSARLIAPRSFEAEEKNELGSKLPARRLSRSLGPEPPTGPRSRAIPWTVRLGVADPPESLGGTAMSVELPLTRDR